MSEPASREPDSMTLLDVYKRQVLGWCVIPFIIPDLVKIALALTLSKRLSKALKLNGQE